MKQFLILCTLILSLGLSAQAQEIDFYDPVEVFDAGTAIGRFNKGDVDGDGIMELIYLRNNWKEDSFDSLVILKRDVTGQYVPHWTFGQLYYSDIKIADMNNDAHNDIILTGQYDLTLIINNGAGGFNSRLSYTIGGGSDELSVADLNNDGYLDVVAPTTHSLDPSYFFNSVFINNKNGTLKPRVQYVYPTVYPNDPITGYYVNVLDMNDDGFKDIVNPFTGKDSLLIYLNKGDGTFNAPSRVVFPIQATDTHVLDLDHDGKEDLACLTFDYINGTPYSRYIRAFYLQKAVADEDIFLSTNLTTNQSAYWNVNIADMNNDGEYDIISSQKYLLGGAPDFPKTDSLVIWLNKGNLTFDIINSSYSKLGLSSYLTVDDYDKDGLNDLLFIEDAFTEGRINIMYNKQILSSVHNIADANSVLTVYPNPSSDKIDLKTEYSTMQSIAFYNTLGNKTFLLEVQDLDHVEIDVSLFPKGLYLIQVQQSNGLISQQHLVLE